MAKSRSVCVQVENKIYRLGKTKWIQALEICRAGKEVPWDLIGAEVCEIDLDVETLNPVTADSLLKELE